MHGSPGKWSQIPWDPWSTLWEPLGCIVMVARLVQNKEIVYAFLTSPTYSTYCCQFILVYIIRLIILGKGQILLRSQLCNLLHVRVMSLLNIHLFCSDPVCTQIRIFPSKKYFPSEEESNFRTLLLLLLLLLLLCGPEQRRLYSELPRVGRSGLQIPVLARFFAPVQSDPAAHPTSHTPGTESFPGIKRPGRGANHPLRYSADGLELQRFSPACLYGKLQGYRYLYYYYQPRGLVVRVSDY